MDSKPTYIWDAAKAESNEAAHGVTFSDAARLDWATALIADDERRNYGERRQIALGVIGNRVHVCVFTDRGNERRIISLRKANRRETKIFIGA